MTKPREMQAARIIEVATENSRIRTIYLDFAMKAEPGEFVMAWLPGMNEKPFSLSYCDGAKIGITIAAVGPFSTALQQVKAGGMLGIRGPFGKGFKPQGEKVAVVGGGCGTAPLIYLVEQLAKGGRKAYFIVGAKTKAELFFVQRAKSAGAEVIACTDDGSEGRKGFTTDALADLLSKEKIDCVFTCGPEVMMKKIADLCKAKGVDCQASLERFMKCGFGLCGQCAIDGNLVCKDGPVFPLAKISKMKEFGTLRRDACGAGQKM